MSISAIFRTKDASADLPPAAAALAALKERSAALQDEDAQWAGREVAAARDVSAHDEALARLLSFEEKHLQAVADREVGLPNAVDPDLIEARITEERARAERLGTRRKIAERMLTSIRKERQRIRTELTAVGAQFLERRHAAAWEYMVAHAEELKCAEAAYLQALAKAFGAARVVNKFARERPQLGFAGDVNAWEILTARPQDAAFNPVPQRPDIHAAIEREADALEKCL